MTSWFKTGLWTPKATPEPPQKVHTPTSSAPAKSGAAPRTLDKLDSGRGLGAPQLLRRSSGAAAQPPRAVDERTMASQRAATFNDLLRDPGVDPAVKMETINHLDRFPMVAAVPVEGSKLTVLEHAVARVARTLPKLSQEDLRAAKRELAAARQAPDAASPKRQQTLAAREQALKGHEQAWEEHEVVWGQASMMMQQYAKLADGPHAAKLATALGKAAMESLKGGQLGAALTTGLVQAGHMTLGAQRRQEGMVAVSRSFAQGGDPVHTAEAHVQADLEQLLGGRSNAARACKHADVESYRREAVAELVLAGAAHRGDISVDTNHFGRDGRVADAVRHAVEALWDVHAHTAEQRAQNGDATPSATFMQQKPHLERLNRLLQLYQNRAVPSAQALRDRLGE